jgi:hypothetical protein
MNPQKMKPQCVAHREANGQKAADVEGRCNHTQRTFPDPACTQRTCERGSNYVDRDSLESGEVEQFRGSIETGSTPGWEETTSGERDQDADRVEPQMPEHGDSRASVDGTFSVSARQR